jgi:hypothetical protein
VRCKSIFLAAVVTMLPSPILADHNCNWLRNTGTRILVNLYEGGNAGFVRDSLVQKGVSHEHATQLVEAVSTRVLQVSRQRAAEYCEYRRTAPSNSGLGEVFGTGPMNFNACMAEYGMSSFYGDLVDSFAQCEGANNILSAIGH